MKIEKKLWVALIAFSVFAVCFSVWIFKQSTDREVIVFDNTVALKEKIFKKLLQQTDSFKTSIFK